MGTLIVIGIAGGGVMAMTIIALIVVKRQQTNTL
jgi:hypothetical protein